MVDTTQANMGLWRPGQDRHVSVSDLLRAFSQTDPAPNRVWPINTTILLELMSMPRPKKFSEEHWFAILQLAAMGFYCLLRPGKYAKSRSNAKDHDTLGKPFQLCHASFLLQNGKYHNTHQLTPCRKRRCNDFELSTMYMAMLSFDDQKSAARERCERGPSLSAIHWRRPLPQQSPLQQSAFTHGPRGEACDASQRHQRSPLLLLRTSYCQQKA